jgi:hypothetical protein
MAKANVTNADIYEAIGGLRADVRNLIARQNKTDDRMGAVEKRVVWMVGFGSAIGAFLGLFSRFIH